MAEPETDDVGVHQAVVSPATALSAAPTPSRARTTRGTEARERWRQAFRDHASCRSSTRLLLWELAAHTDTGGRGASPGVARLATAAGVSPATVKRALDWGRATGWIARTKRGARRLAEPDTYALTVPDPSTSMAHTEPLQRVSTLGIGSPPAPAEPAGPAAESPVAAMSAADFKATVLIPSYGVVSGAELDALRETYWSKLGAESTGE